MSHATSVIWSILHIMRGRGTEHTPKDLAGWHVCLDVVQALMDGRPIPAREDEWKTRYEQYVQAIQAL